MKNSLSKPSTYARRTIYFLLLTIAIFFNNCQQNKVSVKEAETKTETALDQYVNSADTSYRYEIVYRDKKEGYSYYVLKMVSQTWLSETEVDAPQWWHWIKIVVPDSVKHSSGLMWIGGGNKNDELPRKPGQILEQSSLLTHSVTAEIHNIPNQPLNFKGDTYGPRSEDELIAYGWRKFLEGGAKDKDAVWLARLPMTKAVVRAMDAVSEVVLNEKDIKLDNYVASGASKRGWTTWETAAVDDRVIAIVPIVIDLLNLVPSFDSHWRNYGFWAPAIYDYEQEGVMDWLHTMEFARLLEITEPYSYLDRFDIPKYLINATGDQFFQPESWKFYWDDLAGEKYLRYVPNTGHSMKDTDVSESLISFYQYILNKNERPQFEWELEGNKINIITDSNNPPSAVKLWKAVSNEKAKDFRVDVIGKVWKDSTLLVNASGKYQIILDEPENGWKAYFVELMYKQENKLPLKLTTGVSVLPNKYPFEPFVSSWDKIK